MRARIRADVRSPAASSRAIVAGLTSRPRASRTIGTTASRAIKSLRVASAASPKPVMRRKRAIIAAQRNQPSPEQGKMHGFIRANRKPVGHEFARLTGSESAGPHEGEVDGNKFDMGKRMEHRDPVYLRAATTPARHPVWREQCGRIGRAGRSGIDLSKRVRKASEPPIPRDGPGTHCLCSVAVNRTDRCGRPNACHRKSCAALPR